MSRIGRSPIDIPAGVDVKIDGQNIVVKGTNGTLEMVAHENMAVEMKDNQILVSRPNDQKENRGFHGLTRSLIFNMVEGVTQSFKKNLEIHGVGFRAEKKGKELVLYLGYSHTINMMEPEGITVDVTEPTKITVSGADKQAVGQFAANIREKRKPEPYKGKGIRYVGEVIIRKEGKTGSL